MPGRKVPLLIILTWLTTFSIRAGDIAIGLFHGKEIQTVVFTAVAGEFVLTGDGKRLAVIRKRTMFYVEKTGQGLTVHDTLQSYGIFKLLEFKGISDTNIFQVKPVFPSLPGKESEDFLSANYYNDAIQLINRLDLEKYIPGTVEAEGGTSALPEYYKAQAIITRTFAVKNFHRHAHEGFNLCDGVHCQAFNGKSHMNKQIYACTLATKNMILVDANGEPVITAYHANCGGVTGSAAVEWNRELPYLVPVKDPFCDKSANRNWSVSMPMDQWDAYLESKGYFKGSEELFSYAETGRHKYLDETNNKLPLNEIRKDLKLKSSYFHIEQENHAVIIRGHGYGHGLGLCQEGAMEMARVGYTFVDILMFYFRNVKTGQSTL
jgi:stage II sporulation protein D